MIKITNVDVLLALDPEHHMTVEEIVQALALKKDIPIPEKGNGLALAEIASLCSEYSLCFGVVSGILDFLIEKKYAEVRVRRVEIRAGDAEPPKEYLLSAEGYSHRITYLTQIDGIKPPEDWVSGL